MMPAFALLGAFAGGTVFGLWVGWQGLQSLKRHIAHCRCNERWAQKIRSWQCEHHDANAPCFYGWDRIAK
jgi:hypothetical protein